MIQWQILNDIRITFVFGTFELRKKVTFQWRWFLVRHFEIFVLLNNYVTLDLQKHAFLIKSDMRNFFVRSGDVWKVRHNYLTSWFVKLLYLFLRQNYVINTFLTMTYFSWRYDYVPLTYVELCMEILYGNYVSFLFVIVTYFLLRYNYVI